MQFTLTGFTQDLASRVFAFERMGADRTRTYCTVRADLTLVRRYGIQIQDLPLLCRSLLERRGEAGDMPALVFTEDEMRVYSNERSAARAAAASKRKAPRRPTGGSVGAAWRGPRV